MLVTLVNVRVLPVAPEMDTPFFFHWSVGVGLPEAPTLNETFVPKLTVLPTG